MTEAFTLHCTKSYDRHKYKLYLTNGKVELYEWYDEVQARWFQTPKQFLSHIEVIDRKKKR
jgi:hypothetical protein